MSSNGSLSVGRLFGIPFRIHWSVALIAVLFGTSLAVDLGWAGAVLALGAFLASIVAHELAHALVARHYGITTESIQLWALGGVARLDREARTPRAEGWIAAAGPLASIGVGVVSVGAAFGLAALDLGGLVPTVLLWLGIINLALAVFNLLPGAPLDGGRILKAWRWGRHGDRFRATREAANAGRAVGWSVAGIGAVALLNGRPGLMLVLTGMFIAMNARAELMSADVAERLQGVRVGDLTWYGVAHAPADTDADTIVFQRRRLGEAGIVAVDAAQVGGGDERIVGIVSEDQLMALPPDVRPWVTLSSMMIPVQNVTRAEPDEELASVLSRLHPRAPFVTVWRDGKLLGVVPTKRLLARLRSIAG